VASLLLVGWTSGNSNGGPILNCRCELSNDKSNRRLGRYSDPESNGENPTSPRGAQRPERLSLPLTPNIKHRHLDRRNRQSHRLLRSGETPYFAFAFACSCRCLCFWVPQGFSGCWKCRVLLKDTASTAEVRLLLLRPLFQHPLQPWVSLKIHRAAASTLPKTGVPNERFFARWVVTPERSPKGATTHLLPLSLLLPLRVLAANCQKPQQKRLSSPQTS